MACYSTRRPQKTRPVIDVFCFFGINSTYPYHTRLGTKTRERDLTWDYVCMLLMPVLVFLCYCENKSHHNIIKFSFFKIQIQNNSVIITILYTGQYTFDCFNISDFQDETLHFLTKNVNIANQSRIVIIMRQKGRAIIDMPKISSKHTFAQVYNNTTWKVYTLP